MSQTTSAAPSPTISTVELTRIASQIRRDIVRQVHGVQSGHPGGSLGCADFFTALYFKILKHSPQPWDMDGKDQDLFFLSNGHVSPVFYGALARSGYFPVKELATFRRINSRLQGHPTTHEGLPGVRMASGSLGQGLSVAIGAALAKKMNGDDRLVYTNARVGQITDYDKLTLEVWTNGAVKPVDAVALAAKILKDQLSIFINFEEEEEPVQLGGQRSGAAAVSGRSSSTSSSRR